MNDPVTLLEQVITDLARTGEVPQELAGRKLERSQRIDDLGIDSLGLNTLIAELEDRTGMELPEDAAVDFETVGDFAEYIQARRG